MDTNGTALQEQFAAAFQSFIDTCSHLDLNLYEQKILAGQWSPKNIVAHMTGWEHEATERFWRFLAGPTEDVTYNVDEFNSRSVAARQHLTWEQTIRELKAARQALQEPLAVVTSDDLERESRFSEWLEAMTRHYAEHTAQLRHFIE